MLSRNKKKAELNCESVAEKRIHPVLLSVRTSVGNNILINFWSFVNMGSRDVPNSESFHYSERRGK